MATEGRGAGGRPHDSPPSDDGLRPSPGSSHGGDGGDAGVGGDAGSSTDESAQAFERAASRLQTATKKPSSGSRRALALRIGAVIALLGAGLAATLIYQRQPEIPRTTSGGHIVFVDVEGWYRRTSHEVAVLTPFDLALSHLPDGLPLEFGSWRGSDRQHDPAVDEWFRDPDVSIERTYRRGDGELVWLSAFGSRGLKSFHLYEHTPDTCYPLGGWEIEHLSVAGLPSGPLPLSVNHGVARRGDEQLVFVYFYVWDTPVRDAEHGVLSIRLAAPVRESPDATLAMLAEDFLPELFPTTLSWARF